MIQLLWEKDKTVFPIDWVCLESPGVWVKMPSTISAQWAFIITVIKHYN